MGAVLYIYGEELPVRLTAHQQWNENVHEGHEEHKELQYSHFVTFVPLWDL